MWVSVINIPPLKTFFNKIDISTFVVIQSELLYIIVTLIAITFLRGSRHFSTVLKTLFYKNYFSIFFTPSIRFPPCKEVHPPKVFFGKTVWGRRKEPYIFLKPTPGQTGLHPRPVYAQKTCQKLRQQSSYCTPTPCIILGGGTAADVKGGFLVLHTVCSKNQVKRWNLNKNVAKCVFSSNLFY